MTAAEVAAWVAGRPFSPLEVDCATAVMLKILDGKCRMGAEEKVLMAHLYDALGGRAGHCLGPDLHALIARARGEADDTLRNELYEKRVLAETAIARPAMKAFKARLRQEGLLAGIGEADDAVAPD